MFDRSSKIPQIGEDTISREQRMRELLPPSKPAWNHIILPALGLGALAAYYNFVLSLKPEASSGGSDNPLSLSIRDDFSLPKAKQGNLSFDQENFRARGIDSDLDFSKYREKDISLNQILQGNKTLKPGDRSWLLYPVNLCLGPPPCTDCFSRKLSEKLTRYQLQKKISATGELDKATLLALFNDGVLEEKEGSLQLGAQYLKKVKNIESLEGRNSLVLSFIGGFEVARGSNLLEARLHHDGIGSYRTFIKEALNDAKLKGWSGDHVKVKHLRDIETLLDAGFTQPLILPSRLLEGVAKTYRNPDSTRPLAVIFVGEDYNGAFYHGAFPEIISFLLENRFNIRFVSAYDKKDFVGAEKLSRHGLPSDKQSAFTVLAWHGSKNGYYLSSNPNKSASLQIGDQEIQQICDLVAKDGAVISYACSTAEGGRFGKNMVSHLAKKCAAGFISGPQQPCNLEVTSEPEDPRLWTTVKFKVEGGEPIPKLYLRYENPSLPAHMDNQIPAIVFRRDSNGKWRIPVSSAKN